MNKRTRKKWKKKNGTYFSPSECWNLDDTIAHFVLPRLKYFKKYNNGYPGREPMDTPEKWDAAIDKMIRAFELIDTQWDGWDSKYHDLDNHTCDIEGLKRESIQRDSEIKEGLHLFAEYIQHLWW